MLRTGMSMFHRGTGWMGCSHAVVGHVCAEPYAQICHCFVCNNFKVFNGYIKLYMEYLHKCVNISLAISQAIILVGVGFSHGVVACVLDCTSYFVYNS